MPRVDINLCQNGIKAWYQPLSEWCQGLISTFVRMVPRVDTSFRENGAKGWYQPLSEWYHASIPAFVRMVPRVDTSLCQNGVKGWYQPLSEWYEGLIPAFVKMVSRVDINLCQNRIKAWYQPLLEWYQYIPVCGYLPLLYGHMIHNDGVCDLDPVCDGAMFADHRFLYANSLPDLTWFPNHAVCTHL